MADHNQSNVVIMSWLEKKYATLLRNKLRNFKVTQNLFNFSCPICGDSQKNKRKARGYLYEKKGKYFFHCHNCGAGMSFDRFLQEVDSISYQDFVKERLIERREQNGIFETVEPVRKISIEASKILSKLKVVSELNKFHPTRRFAEKRKIPRLNELYHVDEFMHWTNSIIPGKFSENALKHDKPRLVIPFVDKKGNLHAYQGRSIDGSEPRYITIVLDESVPSVYGTNRLDSSKIIIALEGPIDSMFLENGVAVGGGEFVSKLRETFGNSKNLIVALDNEPRSPETRKKMNKVISAGYKVCFWPNSVSEKDVNDMILSGYSSSRIQNMIIENAASGLEARLKLNEWSKS